MVTAPIPAVQQQVITVNTGQGVVVTYYDHDVSLHGSLGAIKAVLTLLILCVLPLFVLVLWRKPEVVEAFNATAAPSPANAPHA